MYQKKRCIENQNTHFVFGNFFLPKIVPFMRECRKIHYSQAGRRRQRNTVQKIYDFSCQITKTQTHNTECLFSRNNQQDATL